MKDASLKMLSMAKYERLMPRIFPSAMKLEIRDLRGALFWQLCGEELTQDPDAVGSDDGPAVLWSAFGSGIERMNLPCGEVHFRTAIMSRQFGKMGWLIVAYDTEVSIPMATAPEPLRRAFSDATAFLHEEIELQSECNELAIELTERYEELNLVYSTKDQVEYFEEGQDALDLLIKNCAEYLDVGLSVLVCRDRALTIHEVSTSCPPPDIDALLELLETTVYDHIESQVSSIVLNDNDAGNNQKRLLGDHDVSLLAYPIIDDHGTAIGMLAVVARRDVHVFSNGDRNLLEVMAKKASRIIHTHHDSLTGLMNRAGFESSLVRSLASTRDSNLQHCLLYIDIDQLHVVNDLMGYQEGDQLIRRIAKLLRGIVRDSDFLARLGGDEFGALLCNCDINQAHEVAEKIRNCIHELKVVSASRQLSVSTSIGLAPINRETDGVVALMASAEIACKTAKEDGRDRIQAFQQDNTTLVRRSEEVEWIGRVHEALREDKFVLYCQPVKPVKSERAAHFEILVRMLDVDGGILAPNLFLPAAERYQLMPLVDRWVIRKTLQMLSASNTQISESGAVFCINLSGQSLTNTGFLAFVAHEINMSGVSPEQICFEITETAAISNIDEAIAFMDALKLFGCRFSLDDFGAGLSSFGYLKELPVDYLKIDGSFVREVTSDKVSLSMVQAICQIGKTMGLSIVAEYVGDQATVNTLQETGVDYLQGYFIGKPAPFEDTLERVLDNDQVESA